MSLRDALDAALAEHPPVCSVAALDLSPEDREKLDRAFGKLSARHLWELLRSNGYAISRDAVERHKSRRCPCSART